MDIRNCSVEMWLNQDNNEHIARCARVCYASQGSTSGDVMCKGLRRRGHYSMFRHGTKYWIIPKESFPRIPGAVYVSIIDGKNGFMYMSANLQWVIEHKRLAKSLKDYEVCEDRISASPGYMVIRRTFAISFTQISTTRELNRVSPNNIAEQSTRYVDFGKKGGITIAKPHWYDGLSPFKRWVARVFWKIDEFAYNLFKKWGLKPEDAREFLPLCTSSKVVYTYSLKEWGNILNLRFWGTTGKPHPNAKLVAGKIRELLIDEGFPIFDNEIAKNDLR